MHFDFSSIIPSLPFILEGILVTLKFTTVSLLCGLPLGLLLGFAKISSFKPIKKFANVYTSIFRGTPLLVQLGLVFHATQPLTGYVITPFEAGIITFSLNSAAYTSVIIYSGLQAIDVGQWEAAKVLGIPYRTTLYHIILPQAFRDIFPSLMNEIIDLLKESALVSTIGEADLLRRSQIVAAEKFLYFEPLIVAAFGYFLMVTAITALAKRLEKKLSYA
jgi:polar amino acid transport system permease protein/polar amino acid transport system substrate-binding protein